MEISDAKLRILDAALTIFSKKGFDATSVGDIAKAVGIKTPSLYSHFESKQQLYETLWELLQVTYEKRSIFTATDWEDSSADFSSFDTITVDGMIALLKKQLQLVVKNPNVNRIRKLLVLDQYRDAEAARKASERLYDDVMKYNAGMMRYFARIGRLKVQDTEVLAAQFSLPVVCWMDLCLWEAHRIPEVTELLERHVRLFFTTYMQDI